eukprot:scaffold86983_cov50-Phaeocystis_antarctica.AAC.1
MGPIIPPRAQLQAQPVGPDARDLRSSTAWSRLEEPSQPPHTSYEACCVAASYAPQAPAPLLSFPGPPCASWRPGAWPHHASAPCHGAARAPPALPYRGGSLR